MPLQVYELFVSEISDRFKLKITKVKWSFDISLLVFSLAIAIFLFGDIGSFDWKTIGYSSFHNIGLGTLVTTAINSPAISLMGKLVDKIFVPTPCFPHVENVLKIK